MDLINNFFEFELFSVGNYSLRVGAIILIFLILIVTKIILWLIKKSIFRKRNLDQFDEGNTYSLFQIIKYIVWIIAIGIVLESIGVKVSLLIAGSAALLVGIGLGLQQTFNDIISGVILLSERSIKIGDILEVDGGILKIQEIGLPFKKPIKNPLGSVL